MGAGKSILCKLRIHNWSFVSTKIMPLSCSGKNANIHINQYKCSRCGVDKIIAKKVITSRRKSALQ
jgi:hypothetical protein